MVDLILSDSFTKVEKSKAEEIIRYGVENELSSKAIRIDLQQEGLSYRKQSSLDDIRRVRVTNKALTGDSTQRAEIWYENVFEKFRKTHKLDHNQALEHWKKSVTQTAETVEQAELNAEFWDFYNEVFGD